VFTKALSNSRVIASEAKQSRKFFAWLWIAFRHAALAVAMTPLESKTL
jgi:hypothetical protein